jgi:hypothetical protein
VRRLGTLLILPATAGCSLLLAEGDPPDIPRDGCSGVTLLRDDFEDPAVSHQWKPAGASPPSELDGELVIAIPANGDNGRYESVHAYDLHNGAITVEVIEVIPEDLETELRVTGLREPGFDPDELAIIHRDGELVFTFELAGQSKEDLATVPYAPDVHRFWRVEERNGALRAGTAPDRDGLFNFVVGTNPPASFDQAAISLRVTAETTINLGGVSRFDDFEGEGAGGACPADLFRDEFDGQQLGRMWAQTDLSECQFNAGGGVLSIVSESDGSCELDLAPPISLAGSSVTVRFREHLQLSETLTFIKINRGPGSQLEMVLDGLRLELTIEHLASEIQSASVTLESEEQARLWMITGLPGDRARFEYSSDGEQWSELGQLEIPFPLDELNLRIGVKGDGATVELESVNGL